MSQAIYYLVGPESPAHAVIQECEIERKAWHHALNLIKEKYQATRVSISNSSGKLGGLYFNLAPYPEGFRFTGECYVPNLRSKKGKAIAEEFDTLPRYPDGMDFSSKLSDETGQQYIHWGGRAVECADYCIHGEIEILAVPAVCQVVPAGCTEMLYSDYMAIYEADKAARLVQKEASDA